MIHQYQLNGYNIVLDVCSGSVHVVDEAAYDLIGLYEDHSREAAIDEVSAKYPALDRAELEECYDDITSLKDAGKLFTPDTFAPMAGELKARTSGVVKALCLHIAHTCNLNCSYCFASQGKYHGDRALMSFEVGKQALDFLIAHSGTRKNLEVDFFGGEPLMNFDVVKQLVAYARSIEKEAGKNFRFTLTTNGVLIDQDVIDFCNKEMSNVVLSLDGRKEVHDRFRVDYAGHGSYDRIVPKFQELVRQRDGKNYYMRGTFTHHNPDFLEDIKTMLNLGKTHDTLTVVDDQIGTPTYTYDLARLLVDMLEKEEYGKYHATNEGGYISWCDFAKEIFRQAGMDVNVIPVSSAEYPAKAKRPSNSRMEKKKLEEHGFTRLPDWKDALGRYLKEIM